MEQYLDAEFWKIMSNCTNVNSTVNTGRSINTKAKEIERFIGASILMSTIGYPRLRMFWQKSLRISAVADVISRTRYFQIRSNLKVVIDLDVPDEMKAVDRLWKVRPIMDRVRVRCLQQDRCRDVSVDEQMISFSGASPACRYVPNKLNPIGFKKFVLASSTGIVLDFIVDQGVATYHVIPDEFRVGVGGAVIAHLAESLHRGSQLYCDRYFTSLPLIDYMLKEHGVHVTGTVMKNRIPTEIRQLSDDRELVRKGRRSCELTVRKDNKITLVKWLDKKPILLASFLHSTNPADKCRRWSKKDKRYIQVERPHIVREYNANMGGVDLCDRMLSFYRIKARTKKWTVRTILYFIDLAIVNSWLQHRNECFA